MAIAFITLANEILYFHGNRTPILGLDAESNIVKVFDDYYHHIASHFSLFFLMLHRISTKKTHLEGLTALPGGAGGGVPPLKFF